MNILIIENDLADRLLIKSKLRQMEHTMGRITFEATSSLKEAVHMVNEYHFDLIIMDLSLDDEILPYKSVQKIETLALHAPVIVLSGSLEDEDLKQDIKNAGAKKFLDKRILSGHKIAEEVLKVLRTV